MSEFVSSALGDVTLTTLFSFGQSNGAQPASGLVQGSDGTLYGTTQIGGAGGNGTVFRITSSGGFSSLFSFTGTGGPYPGANPVADLVFGTNGNLYGTTSSGGTGNCGTIFEVTTSGVFTPLVSFTGTNGAASGDYPVGLVLGKDGNFYGTTQMGGTNDIEFGGDGTVFRMTPNGGFTNLHCFNGADGANPYAGVTQGTNGNFYGTAQAGGVYGWGTVFEMTPGGMLATLVSFDNTNGASPQAGLIQAKDGNFYGTTYSDGGTNAGIVFRMTPAGALTVLFSFGNTNGANPYASLVQGVDGNLYGTTELGGNPPYNNGTAFTISPAGALTTLVTFAGGTNNSYPVADLLPGADGYFYGTTTMGGTYNQGTIFRLPPPPNFLSANRSNGLFIFTWSAAAGQTYLVQFTTNLNQITWHILDTNTAAGPIATNSDAMGLNLQRYYRVSSLP